MPPKNTYIFKHKYSPSIKPIEIETYGDKYTAWGLLEAYVKNIHDWESI